MDFTTFAASTATIGVNCPIRRFTAAGDS